MRISDWSSDVCSSDLTLLITRIILLELTVFLEFRLHGLFGERLAELLGDILRQRLTEVERHLDALRLQYPSFARELDHQVLESFAFREEIEQIQQLRDAGIVNEDLARHLRIETENVHASRRPMAHVHIHKRKRAA